MKAVRRSGPRKVEILEKRQPEPGPGEVLVKVACTGICGSDTHRFVEDQPRWDTLTLGHEFSGVVEQVGPGVDDLDAGEPVTAAPLVPCHRCGFCARGEFSLCESYSFIGSRMDGSFAEYVLVPAVNIVRLGRDFPLERGAFVEPVTVCLHPLMRLGNLLGRTVVVTGLGTIGLLAIQVFRAMGAKIIVASDIVPAKLDLARTLGATHAVNAADTSLEDQLDRLGGADVVFESSGTNPAKLSAIRIARGRGTVLLVGTSPKDIVIDAGLLERITRRELNLVGSWMNYSAPWPGPEWTTAVWMLKEGLVRTDELVTHRFPLGEFQRALDVVLGGKELTVKVLIVPGDRK